MLIYWKLSALRAPISSELINLLREVIEEMLGTIRLEMTISKSGNSVCRGTFLKKCWGRSDWKWRFSQWKTTFAMGCKKRFWRTVGDGPIGNDDFHSRKQRLQGNYKNTILFWVRCDWKDVSYLYQKWSRIRNTAERCVLFHTTLLKNIWDWKLNIFKEGIRRIVRARGARKLFRTKIRLQ